MRILSLFTLQRNRGYAESRLDSIPFYRMLALIYFIRCHYQAIVLQV